MIANSKARALNKGVVIFEIILALSFFAITAVAFTTALQQTGRVAQLAEEEVSIARIMDSAMTDALSRQVMEEGEEVVELKEFGDQRKLNVKTAILPIDFLENKDGQLLEQMFRIEITATWNDGSELVERKSHTWRNAQIYRAE